MKFLICGYYGFDNAGDELLLCSTIKLLQTNHRNADICVLSKNPALTAKAYGVRAVSRYNPFSILYNLFATNRVIIGGGGLLQDFTGPLTLYYYLAIALLGIMLGKQTVFHAVGANQLNVFNVSVCRFVLNLCTSVTVRDRRSGELLSQWGVQKDKISLTADPVFAIPLCSQPQPDSSPHCVVLMVLRHNSDISPYASAVKSLVGIAGGKAVVLPFQPSKDGKISIGLSRAAPEYVGLGIWHDLQSLLCQFDECRFVISGRYHALVLAAMRGIPAVCVSDDDKLIRIARDFDYPVLRPSDNFDGSALVAVAERIWKYREILKPGLLRKSAIQATLARNNSALL